MTSAFGDRRATRSPRAFALPRLAPVAASKGRALGVLAAGLVLAGCAGSPKADLDCSLGSKRDRATPSDRECREADVGEVRESRAQVEAAEQKRIQSAFSAQVAAWRARLATRTATRTRTSEQPATAQAAGEPLAEPSSTPSVSLPRLPGLVSEKRPSPELLLGAAACLLDEVTTQLEGRVRMARGRGREDAGAVALLWVDATSLSRRVSAAAADRNAPACTVPSIRKVERNLRRLLGTSFRKLSVQELEAGLRRLDRELQKYAGLSVVGGP